MRGLVALVLLVLLVLLGGCVALRPADERADGSAADAGSADGGGDAGDGGGSGDAADGSGPGDAATDSPAPDPCFAASFAAAAPLRGCNGPIPGPGMPGEYNGACVVGSASMRCTTANTECSSYHVNDGDVGFCMRGCTNPVGQYAGTGSGPLGPCPRGYRCITALMDGTFGQCYPDCVANTDCVSNVCDPSDATCWFADGPPP